MTKAQRAEMYRSYLAAEGYPAQVDGDGDVTFKYEGGNYYIMVDETDEEFFRIVYPNFWPIEDESERAKVKEASGVATAQTKVAKVFPVNDNTWASSEIFCSPPEAFKSVFRRSLLALRAAVQAFVQSIQG